MADDMLIDSEHLSDDDIEDAEDRTHQLLLKFFGVVHDLITDTDSGYSKAEKYDAMCAGHHAIGTAMTAIANDLEIKSTGKMVN